jgi:uncharacterized OB-fold protein
MEGKTIPIIGAELEEQANLILLSNLVNAEAEEAVIGRPVEVVFEEIGGGFALPQFRLTQRTNA